LLEFVGEGKNGLLGYSKNLLNSGQSQLDLQRETTVLENNKLRQCIEELVPRYCNNAMTLRKYVK